jgi:periplasmic protein TonB
MALRKRKRSPILLVSVAAHLGLAAVIAVIPQQKLREVVAIALAETSKREEPKPPQPRSEPPKASRPTRSFNASVRPLAAQAIPQADLTGAANFRDIGISLDGNSADGLAIPNLNVDKKPIETISVAPQRAPKILVSKRLETVCDEEIVKPIPEVVVRPEYTDAAREGHIEGRVRVEILVDEFGGVSSARVVKGLGYGLDEAALEAVKKMRFRPGTRCSKPIATPFVMAVRFLLGS